MSPATQQGPKSRNDAIDVAPFGFSAQTLSTTRSPGAYFIERRVALRMVWDADQWFAAREVNALAEHMHHKPSSAETTVH
jgi:hypothetical protein